MTDTTNNAEDISAAPSVRGYYEAPPFRCYGNRAFPTARLVGVSSLEGLKSNWKSYQGKGFRKYLWRISQSIGMGPRRPLGEISVQGGEGRMVTFLQDRTSPREGITLAFGCSQGAGLIFLSPAVGSFKATRFVCKPEKSKRNIKSSPVEPPRPPAFRFPQFRMQMS